MSYRSLIFPVLILILAVGAIALVFAGRGSINTISPVTASTEQKPENAVNESLVPVKHERDDNRRLDVLIAAGIARQAPALHTGEWLNSEPTTLKNLRGRVVLVDFWTYGCYNCRNTLPTLKRFDTDYRNKGLTIVGVHTPEFAAEKEFANVRKAVEKHGIQYPIITDANGDSWRAFDIEAWPTVVILDKQGRIRYTHIGEGAYDVQEAVIKALLSEAVAETKTEIAAADDDKFNEKALVKSEAEWRKRLTAEQFYVLREKGTERAFTGALDENHEHGDYHCAACHLKLFSSAAKFESGTGWPSFFRPINAKNVTEKTDSGYGMKRTEVLCSRCSSHLGHVFDDGPAPTGLRYCMNSVALKFEKK